MVMGDRVYLESEAICPEEAVYCCRIAASKGIRGISKSGREIDAVADFIILSGSSVVDATTAESSWIGGDKAYQNARNLYESRN
tara:strand:- start:24845 stop:25096 length:252 start_codon:yes stop_codon:yes gene_type:complete